MSYLYQHKNVFLNLQEDWACYDPHTIEKYSTLPEATREYYKRAFAEGKQTLLWHLVPHILYKGSIDISELEVFEM